ncbi:MAG: helicase C-terminal domain-containing protein [Candidatus Thiodiazotropha sp. (ex Lucinoma aequizonata)]|nr:helicase C-terminal domain-containing protein [Candidatus Thiodiazotropha sp. (ex Lucinoma aequizonata)]MCU7888570.1 helicase C-terminal domain-containing protein [Candidatus Thiodiazotropha sp. (ex Lucinoma aequizonata)]MCU7895068.1 helicase C-terminal domain-containing protein [Candidatus Thiodiazotropha sp. (ex Lucinoma aequizonata)]MCU7897214.1 helicase C-terminal domain-containing protein [Candidatus Thiodiazotropha sp. (ex Lucinoma aequizonata)]MCU7903231.1 helicase C-terminal domain-c
MRNRDVRRRLVAQWAVKYRVDFGGLGCPKIFHEIEDTLVGQGRDEESADTVVSQAQKVEEAFNSPFWPFVLTSTSISQEGLDFHWYCHVIVHCNLPSNPVDLEQREGRVHCYKGHAVRKNIAIRYGRHAMESHDKNPWYGMLEVARKARREGENDLVPYWIYLIDGGARVERYVPLLPLTRDRQLIEALRRSLAVYRLVFGQPRQDDLIEYLYGMCQKKGWTN